MDAGPLAAEFLQALRKPIDLSNQEVEVRITALHDVGRAAWPDLDVSSTRFARHLGQRAASVSQPVRWLESAHADGLYLACACADAMPRALALFETHYLTQVPTYLARLQLTPTAVDEIRQIVRARLFVGEKGAPPRIGEFSGEGPLGAWLRVVAQRVALTELRRRSDSSLPDHRSGDGTIVELAADPELQLIKARHKKEFAEAFRDALAAQSSETRNLLRLHYLDGLNIDKLGALYQVHRATTARWLQSARDAVFSETRRLVQQRLRLSGSEFDSFVRAIGSELDLSITGALRDKPPIA